MFGRGTCPYDYPRLTVQVFYIYKYIEIYRRFAEIFKACNDTVHSVTDTATSRLTDAYVIAIWIRMEARKQSVRVAKAKFRVGQHMRISKEKMKFAKSAEHNFSAEIFWIVKVIHRNPLAVYELQYLNGTPIDGHF